MDSITGLLAVIGTFTFVPIIIFIVFYYRHKERSEKNKVLVELANNKELPSEERKLLIESLTKNTNCSLNKSNYLKNGIVLIGVGVGLLFIGYLRDETIYSTLVGIGFFIGCIGLSYLIYGHLEKKENKKHNL